MRCEYPWRKGAKAKRQTSRQASQAEKRFGRARRTRASRMADGTKTCRDDEPSRRRLQPWRGDVWTL